MDVISKRLESQFPDYKGWGAMVVSLARHDGAQCPPGRDGASRSGGIGAADRLRERRESVAGAFRQPVQGSGYPIGDRRQPRARLVRQFITETMLLTVAGSLAGLALAYGGLRLLVASGCWSTAAARTRRARRTCARFHRSGHRAHRPAVRCCFPRVSCSAATCSSRCASPAAAPSIPGTGRRSRNALVISEVALSLMLTMGATLMLRSLLWLESEDRGFSPDHQLSFRVSPAGRCGSGEFRAVLSAACWNGSAAIPGVKAIAATNNLPVDGYRQVGGYFKSKDRRR